MHEDARLHVSARSLRPTGDVSESFEQGVLHEEDVESRYCLRGVRVGEAWMSHTRDEDSDVVDVTHVSQR